MGRCYRHLLFASGHAHWTEERYHFLWCDSITQCRQPAVTSTDVPFRIPMNNIILKLCAEQSADFVRSSYETYKYNLLAECMASECETRR